MKNAVLKRLSGVLRTAIGLRLTPHPRPLSRKGRGEQAGFVILAAAIIAFVALTPATAQQPAPLRIRENTKLDPAKTYGPLIVEKSDIVIDGNGATIVGDAEGKAKNFKGIGVSAKGVSGVTLKNIKVRGFETGLKVEDGANWTVESCDFSGNFHDPDFGWGENGHRGGIVFIRVRDSKITNAKANNVWNGLTLNHSDGNVVTKCDFSKCSNVGLHLWRASKGAFEDNKIDEGIRIAPKEVHARDSSCLLMESGSNDNVFRRNSFTKGGDGVFIRSLNGWVSTGNLFEDNDCSYANNNAVECWSPGNTFRRNKANHSSYGFWMGGSDRTVLEDNEASFNGDPKGYHNSPHLPKNGHAGIVFMYGTGTHVVARGNRCVNNNGAGIALIGDQGKQKLWKASHWVIERNVLENNRWGIFVENADWVDIGPNSFKNNSLGDIFEVGGVTNLTRLEGDPAVKASPKLVVAGPEVIGVGETAAFDAGASSDPSGRPLKFRWSLSDGTTVTTAKVEHAFKRPGFYQVGVTATNGVFSDLGWRNVYVVSREPELGTESSATAWTFTDPGSKVTFADDSNIKLVGKSSLRATVDKYSGGRVLFNVPIAAGGKAISLDGKKSLSVWIRARNLNIPSWQDGNPLVVVRGADGGLYELKPKSEPLNAPEQSEAREGWMLLTVPLHGGGIWTAKGNRPAAITGLSLGFDSWGGEPLEIWLDGLRLE
jgi:parallel beta-helix repeat protein